jgi:glucan phosphoethanolaminetransferase (alkaline phosphatase superfamily)
MLAQRYYSQSNPSTRIVFLIFRGEEVFFVEKKNCVMIQRVQTIFLFLIAVGMGVTLSTQLWMQGDVDGDYWTLSAFMLTNFDQGGEVIQSSSKWYLAALAVLAAILALASIFQYRLRSRQLLLNMINSLVMVSLVAATFLTTNGINEAIQGEDGGDYGLGFWSILVSMVMNMLANRFIKKDEALVRSVDRIR